MGKKALIAMSGGVDSSAAAILMKKAGYECAGAMMRLWRGANRQDELDAAAAAKRLGIEFYVFDFCTQFEERVIADFIKTYETGGTPNPCISCNRHLKFGALLEKARSMGFDCLATGHYARCGFNASTGRYEIKKAADEKKDQSYVLYSLSQETLSHCVFPLGGMSKSEIRELAAEAGLELSAKKESQDICFVPDGDYASFIERHTGKTFAPGDFVSVSGEKLGTHRGIIRYTIGQRRGLGISHGAPLFVCGKDAASNRVILSEGAELFSRTVTARDVNLVAVSGIEDGMRVLARTRYNMKEQPASVYNAGEGSFKIVFDEPQRAAAPGQALVMYRGDTLIGGGTIV